MCVCVCVCVYVPHLHRCPWSLEEDVRSPTAGVTGGYKLPNVDIENWTRVFCNSSNHSFLVQMYVFERFACRYVWASGMCLVPEEVRIGHQTPGNQAHALNCWIISLAPYLYWDRVSLWSWMPRNALAVASRALGSRMCVNMTSLSVSMLDCWAISSVPRKTHVWFCYVFFFIVIVLFLWDSVSLCNPTWPGMTMKYICGDSPVSTSWVLGLRVSHCP